MARLYVLGGPDVGRSFEVESGAVLGRSPDCDVALRHRSVSRHHARLERAGERWFVVDLGARNGVRLAGERVQRAELADGDEIVLGELPLRFRAAAESVELAPAGAAEPLACDEIVLEDDGAPADLGATAIGATAIGATAIGATAIGERFAAPAPRQVSAAARGTTALAAAPAGERAAPELTPRERRREELLAEIARGRDPGLLGGDLAQRPLWARFLFGLLALGVLAAAVAGSFALVRALRDST